MESNLVQREGLEDNLMRARILEILHARKCKNVQDLVNDVHGSYECLSVTEIRDLIRSLEEDDKIILVESEVERSFLRHVTKNYHSNLPFWLSVITISLTFVTTYLLPETGIWTIIRIISGSAVVLLIPGYGLVGMLFPKKDFTLIERLGLALALSLALVPILWLIMSYFQLGVRIDLVIAGVSVAGMLLIFGDTYRQFLSARKKHLNSISK